MTACSCPACKDHGVSLRSFYDDANLCLIEIANAIVTEGDFIVEVTARNEASREILVREWNAAPWKQSSSRSFAQHAIQGRDRGSWLLVARNKEGDMLGVAEYRKSLSEGGLHVNWLASTSRQFGTGTRLMREVANKAIEETENGTVSLMPVESARSFYQGIGFKDHPTTIGDVLLDADTTMQVATEDFLTTANRVVDASKRALSDAAKTFKAEYQAALVDTATKSYITGEVEASRVLETVGNKASKGVLDWSLIQQDAVNYATNYRSLLVNDGVTLINGQRVAWSAGTLDEDVRGDIADLVLRAITEGKPLGIRENSKGNYPKGSLANDLKDYFTEARTEVMRHRNAGHVQTYLENDIVSVVGNSFECCELCDDEVNGIVYNLGEQPDLPLHPNCRCVWEPIIPGYDYNDGITDPSEFNRAATSWDNQLSTDNPSLNESQTNDYLDGLGLGEEE